MPEPAEALLEAAVVGRPVVARRVEAEVALQVVEQRPAEVRQAVVVAATQE